MERTLENLLVFALCFKRHGFSSKAAGNIQSGFEVTRIYPPNRAIVCYEHEYVMLVLICYKFINLLSIPLLFLRAKH